MCIGVESSYLPHILAFNIHLFCVCVSVYVFHYFIVFVIIFIHSITTVTFHHKSTRLIYTVWVFCTAIHWWRWLYSHRNVWITVKCGLVRTKGSWLIYVATWMLHTNVGHFNLSLKWSSVNHYERGIHLLNSSGLWWFKHNFYSSRCATVAHVQLCRKLMTSDDDVSFCLH